MRAGLAGALGCGSSASAPGADGGAASSEASIPPGDATTLANGADGAGDDQSDSGPTGSADSGAPAGFPPMFTKFGTVGARWRHNPDGGDVTDIEALFVDYGAAGTACTSVSVGACVRLHCPGPDGGGEDPNADPGTIEIGSPPAQVTLTYPGPNEGQGSSPDKLLWPPGTSIPITSSGSADVPAWSTAVTLPSMATVTVPGMIDGGPLTLQRIADFAVSWTGAPDLVVGLELLAGGYDQLACTFSGGAGVIPASTLGLLSPGTYDLELFTADRQYFSAGPWSVRATADTLASCAGGAPCEVTLAKVE